MTPSEINRVIDALHKMEVGVTERLARLEALNGTYKQLQERTTKVEERVTLLTLWCVALTILFLGKEGLGLVGVL